jgi:hypothetical protein
MQKCFAQQPEHLLVIEVYSIIVKSLSLAFLIIKGEATVEN